MITKELAGRKGKQEDGTAKTREAKLGCVFTQLNTDKPGEVDVFGDSWYSSQSIIRASRKRGFQYIGVLKTN
jgi:hypothetical protein